MPRRRYRLITRSDFDGLVCAVLEARTSGRGQVVDAAMVDGATSLMTMIYGLHAAGYWTDQRASNRLDSGAPWYNVYRTRDDRFVALGSNEPRFSRCARIASETWRATAPGS